MTSRLIERHLRLTEPSRTLAARLTEREREVLGLVARGLSNAEIAARMHLGEATVRTDVGHVFAKTGARDRAQAVVFAYESGHVRPGEVPPARLTAARRFGVAGRGAGRPRSTVGVVVA